MNKKTKSKLEAFVLSNLKKRRIDFEYESLKIPYTISSVYTPDFVLNDGKLLIECKGYHPNLNTTLKKYVEFKRSNPKIDLRFCFDNANMKIGKRLTISGWADKHGFLWCEKVIPEEWIKCR